ncbi:MAG: polysaccharide deacetylase family protein [Eubacteriales bacterium]|nr:polysaccharide deacetylase family protein [Eubacteriales bacterium]
MVGTYVPIYSNTVKRMANLGCELGNHSYSHPAFTTLSYSSMQYQVTTTNNLIYDACGKYPTVFRLPYGDGYNNSTVLSALGLPSIFWTVDSTDWINTNNSQPVINAVLNNVRNGDIVTMHDSHYSTVVAAETIIPILKQRGYQLVTVSELAKYKGRTTLQSGRTYFSF